MSVSIYPMVSDSQDGKNSYINLIAVHFKKMSFYRKDWSIQDILVFEAFLASIVMANLDQIFTE